MQNNTLKISTTTACVFDSRTKDTEFLDNKFKYIKECGFDAVDYSLSNFIKGNTWPGEFSDFWDKSLEELYEYFAPTKKAAEKNGVSFAQAHATFPLYVDGNETANDYLMMSMEKTIAVCSFLGCPYVVAHPYTHMDKKRQMEINLGMYRKMMHAALKYKVKICLENMFKMFNGRPVEGACATAEETCTYIDMLNKEAREEAFGYCFDIGHADLVCKNIKNFIKTLGNRLSCLHIHHNNGCYDSHMLPYTQVSPSGKPCTNWDGMIEGLREINYQGDISFEASRGIETFPKEVEAEALKLLSAIGRSFRNRIMER